MDVSSNVVDSVSPACPQPSRMQRNLGALAVLLVLPSSMILTEIGRVLGYTLSVLTDELVLSRTKLVLAAVALAEAWWYLWMPALLTVYFLWISKRNARLLWFNAVIAITIPLLLWFAWETYEAQREVIPLRGQDH